MSRKNSYWKNIKFAVLTTLKGLGITFTHLSRARQVARHHSITQSDYFTQKKGPMTLQYPHEKFEVPEVGRYKLDNEIDDCIVCDKCAKVCPVDCIEIDAVKAPDTYGHTSDGTPKRIMAAKFDIDMGKCCFCGLCTTVCPTECLTMTPEYDYSVYEINDHIFSFANMSRQEIDQKIQELEKAQRAAGAQEKKPASSSAKPKVKPKPIFRKKKDD